MIERQNYLKIKAYLRYLEENLQLSSVSLERYWFYFRHLLIWADNQNFSNAHTIRPGLSTYITSLPGKDGNGTLARATQKKIITLSKRFFRWARATYPREMHLLPISWIDTLRLPRQTKSSSENIFVTFDEIYKIISLPIPENNLALLRDQAAAAMLYLSGMRASAFTTLPISAVDLENLSIFQWPELGVHTKNNKKATTFLYNIPELLVPIQKWDKTIRLALPSSMPWYAPVDHIWGDHFLSAVEPGKNRSQALTKRLKLLFTMAGLEFKSPHKFRHGHAVYGLLHAQTMADYKAVSMNLMHDSIEITDSIYAPMLSSDVKERITNLSHEKESLPGKELESYLNQLSRDGMKQALIYLAGQLTK